MSIGWLARTHRGNCQYSEPAASRSCKEPSPTTSRPAPMAERVRKRCHTHRIRTAGYHLRTSCHTDFLERRKSSLLEEWHRRDISRCYSRSRSCGEWSRSTCRRIVETARTRFRQYREQRSFRHIASCRRDYPCCQRLNYFLD